jgi:transcriptional repressor NrdR
MARSIMIALRKRPVSGERVEQMISGIVRQLESLGDNEVTSEQIGELVMEALAQLDPVAYVRYASVYKDFRETNDFKEILDDPRLGQTERRG